ncbi:MAG: PDC sensor domain-containing protein [Gammaproteobacteria bacterium SHHR-1]|uniref:PDC sensor domain-containing protein n=1 Tax=Magnetovirga frankeli TaxID=947516 RepID=UPI001293C6C0|nr:PDC sensor domain-containing protein [gamma proteobacterium SS-5]
MTPTPAENSQLKALIARQRASLYNLLLDPMQRAARRCAKVLDDKQALDETLQHQLQRLPYATFMYVMDASCRQLSDNASHAGLVGKDFNRDRSDRPYMQQLDPERDMTLSEAYLSLRANRPSVTAVQKIQRDGQLLGYLGADFDLRDLPLTREHYEQPGQWRQIKGDPAIRGQVFKQCRIDSALDGQIDLVIPVLAELMAQNGIFHGKLHFSSSRATVWSLEDPYRFHILSHEELMDPDICLAYPHYPYPKDAMVPVESIRPILDTFKHLRFADQTFYLRAGSINIFNGIVGLNFSCDGSHYIPYDQFLARDSAFWEGM